MLISINVVAPVSYGYPAIAQATSATPVTQAVKGNVRQRINAHHFCTASVADLVRIRPTAASFSLIANVPSGHRTTASLNAQVAQSGCQASLRSSNTTATFSVHPGEPRPVGALAKGPGPLGPRLHRTPCAIWFSLTEALSREKARGVFSLRV